MANYKTFEELLGEALDYGIHRGVDTRQRSIFYDAVAGHCLRTAKFYEDLKIVADLVLLDTSGGEILDKLGKEHASYRQVATKAKWSLIYEGNKPSEGIRFLVDGIYFSFSATGTSLTAEQAGTKANSLVEGLPCLPVTNVNGLKSAVLGKIQAYGTAAEKDADFRERLREKIAGPAGNGNKQHYKTWCESVAGVGRAKIIPQWKGDNTVKGIIIDTNGLPPNQELLDQVQEYVDPGGKGLGEGTANIGSRFTAVGAKAQTIDVAFRVELSPEGDLEQVKAAATQALEKELSRLMLNSPDGETLIIRYSWVGSMAWGLPGVVDYSDLTLNGAELNIVVAEDCTAVLEEVRIT